MLPRHARCVLSRLRYKGPSLLQSSYLSRTGRIENPSCSACGHPSHLSSHSALSSYGLLVSLYLWQFSVSLRPLAQALESFPASGASWFSTINPFLGRGWVTTTTTAKLKLQTHYHVTKRVGKFRRSSSCKQNYVTICNLLLQDAIAIYIYGTPLHIRNQYTKIINKY